MEALPDRCLVSFKGLAGKIQLILKPGRCLVVFLPPLERGPEFVAAIHFHDPAKKSDKGQLTRFIDIAHAGIVDPKFSTIGSPAFKMALTCRKGAERRYGPASCVT
jgi:hypothetical protein